MSISSGFMMLPHQKANCHELLVSGSRCFNLCLTDTAVQRMLRHAELLDAWQPRINVTAIRDPVEKVIRHFLDSLAVFQVLPWGMGFRVLDVGSGGGFPGVVMRVADESLRLTLLDRDARKIVFLKHLVRELALSSVSFVNAAIAQFLSMSTRNVYDVLISRALSSVPQMLDSLAVLVPPRRLYDSHGGASPHPWAPPASLA